MHLKAEIAALVAQVWIYHRSGVGKGLHEDDTDTATPTIIKTSMLLPEDELVTPSGTVRGAAETSAPLVVQNAQKLSFSPLKSV